MEYKEHLKKKIKQTINDSTGLKKLELVSVIVERTPECTSELIEECTIELINEGKIIEIEYEVPQTMYRTKSIFFPAGTEIRIVKPKTFEPK
jgi:hypothetical protein